MSKINPKTNLVFVSKNADLRSDVNHMVRTRSTRGYVALGDGSFKKNIPTLDEQMA